MNFIYVVCVSLVLCAQVDAQIFNQASCTDLEPTGGQISSSAAPILVAATAPSYTPGGSSVSVFIASTTPGLIAQSIILQARNAAGVPVGSFSNIMSGYSTLTCSGSADGTIISIGTADKPLPIMFTWTPPSVGVGDVTFVASYINPSGQVWVRVASGVVTGPLDDVLSIDPCPAANVNGNTATFSPPLCRRGNAQVGVSTCNPASGSIFPTGVTTVTCTCAIQGETASCQFIVTVVGVVAPCNPDPCQNGGTCFEVPAFPSGFFCVCGAGFSGTTCSDGQVDLLSIDSCPVAVVNGNTATFTPPPCRRGTAQVGVSTCSPQSGSTFQNGDLVTCICTNQGETASCQLIVTGIVGSPLTIEPCPPTVNNAGNTYFWSAPTCLRNGNVVGLSTCSPGSGSTFNGPNNPVTCTCNDNGEQATCPFNINAGPPAAVCLNNPCAGQAECREAEGVLAGYTCHITTGLGCL